MPLLIRLPSMTGRLEEGSEVGPIVFRSGRPSALDEGVDHISLPDEPRSFAPRQPTPALSDEPVLKPSVAVRSRSRRGLTRGLALGLIGGALVGGSTTLALRRAHRTPALDQRRPASQMLIQAMSEHPGPASIPAAPAPEPRLRGALTPTVRTPETRRSSGIDLDQLAQAIVAAAPPAAVTAARQPPPEPPPQLVEPPKPAPVIVARAPPPPPPVMAAPKLEAPRPAPRFDTEMALAERELALAYDRAMASAPDRAALHDDQQRWQAQRDRAAGDRQAVLGLYQSRTQVLIEQDRLERKKGGIARLLRD